jgi:aryl-phospho-beta-D-glucosidase BglC (GH1 family)
MPSLSHDLPPLATNANRIIDALSGAPVLLRGVNRSGLEYSPTLEQARMTEEEMEAITRGWGANIVRIPFNQDWALSRDDYDPSPYLAALDTVIERAARRGAYTLLDLQWLDHRTVRGHNADGTPNFVAPLPDRNSAALWKGLAARYREEPAVLFDIFNEPHDPLPDDPGLQGRVRMEEWQPWARELILAIRSEHPFALIWVPGVNWAYDLRGFPFEDIAGVVYSTHIYSNKGKSQRQFRRAFGELAESVPVFAGEWGGADTELDWGREVGDYLEELGMGWTAWSWADWPHLVRRPLAPPYDPTPFGELVKSYLARRGR